MGIVDAGKDVVSQLFEKDKPQNGTSSSDSSKSISDASSVADSSRDASNQNGVPFSTPVFSCSFKVVVSGIGSDGGSTPEFFNSIDGLSKYTSKVSPQAPPGGERGDISFPSNFSTKNLILRRPLMDKSSDISKWAATALKTFSYTPTQIYVFIMNLENDIVAQWTVHNAYPISVSISPVSMHTGNTIIEETIEVKYNDITMDKP